jgi:hypothetical protein
MPKPPMTADDANSLLSDWNESKAAIDELVAKFRESASRDEIDHAIRKMYATRANNWIRVPTAESAVQEAMDQIWPFKKCMDKIPGGSYE